jgi:ribonuclease T
MPEQSPAPRVGHRFRGFLPVVVDVETGGFNNQTDALLEVAAVILGVDENGLLVPRQTVFSHIEPFPGANMEKASMEVNGIKVDNPLRLAKKEADALGYIFKPIRQAVSEQGCTRAILVGHNAHFDLGFMNAAIARTGVKRSPFHPFSAFDTVSIAGAMLGQTVLAKALVAAGLPYDTREAHSAIYDAERTADLFCLLVNKMRPLYESLVGTHPAPAEAYVDPLDPPIES